MPNIRDIDINIDQIGIPDIPNWLTSSPPQAIPLYPPVTTQIGVPIIDIPGCVEAHEQDDGKNENLSGDDPKGVKIYCDGQVPSFNPVDYNKDKLEYDYEPSVPPVKPPEKPETKTPKAETPKPKIPDCPTEAQRLKEPINHIKGNKIVTEYRLVGKECIQITETLSLPAQIVGNIPSAGAVTATASIAVIATTSALLAKPLADLLLKVVKPTVKKVIKKITTLRGKTPPKESVKDRRDQQRIRSHAIRKLKGKE
tara:strand:+ start:751 stop:1515 length:765 start_codon:yes stop_codon:yes gene_type:complete